MRRAGRARIGTSGWNYPRWRGDFYPKGLVHRLELAYMAQRLPTVEVNATFYGLTRPSACAAWRAAVPDEFMFAIKGSRFITHMLKLRKFETPLANFFASGLLRLGSALGPILWQLPPQLPFDEQRTRDFFAAVPRDLNTAEWWARRHDARTTGRAALRAASGASGPIRHAVEIRHASWLTDRALATLREADVALVAADTAGKYPLSYERTAEFAYVRLHGSATLYASRYSDAEVAAWARRINAWTEAGSDVYVYFDNDAQGHAPHDAVRLQAAVDALAPAAARERSGVSVSAPP
ncbi:MAG TPA: DUF72 domain-containing protein [Polyangia bacterium]|nr:DUF72 domain-containing protein [Polyangia bacterium]